jgi:hypothetical protein
MLRYGYRRDVTAALPNLHTMSVNVFPGFCYRSIIVHSIEFEWWPDYVPLIINLIDSIKRHHPPANRCRAAFYRLWGW